MQETSRNHCDSRVHMQECASINVMCNAMPRLPGLTSYVIDTYAFLALKKDSKRSRDRARAKLLQQLPVVPAHGCMSDFENEG